MPFPAGARLGPYEVLSSLGAGGMGEVYRARDTRLERTVAIKVLPEHLAQNADLRQRFEREARAVSSLNHPHICTLHDIGHQDTTDYLVMELIEGETLQERMKKGPLPLNLTLRYGIEIADALDKAHKHGVIHRDLKPGNVMLTKAGSKLMDFGLAKQGPPAAGSDGVSALPTQERPLTQAGSLLGTYQYMSPEQLEGKDADARSDIWALGCVLYEMATGRRAFSGQSQASLISAIMSSEPAPVSGLQPLAPAALDRAVGRCLAKDPGDRWDTAHDLADELRWVAEAAPATRAATAGPRLREWIGWALAACLGLALLGVLVARRPQRESRVVRFEIPAPEGTELQPYLAASPDGSRLAFTAKGEDGLDRLYLRSLDSARSELVTGTDGALQPFWSPDGRSVGFFAQGKLKRVEIGGAAPQTICPVAELRGATWNREGVILFGIGGGFGLSRVAATGGTPEPLTTPDASRGETSQRWPVFLPDGRRFLYLGLAGQSATIWVGSLDGQKPQRLTDAFSEPTFAPSGHLLFVRDGALRAQAIDMARLRLIGEPLTLAEPIQADTSMWGATPVSAGGDVLAHEAGGLRNVQLTWFDRAGRELGTVGPPGDHNDLSLSPDGTTLVTTDQGATQVTLVDIGTGAFRRLTFKPERVGAPTWSPDGRTVAYVSTRHGPFGIFIVPATGVGTEESIEGTGDAENALFSPDGQFLLYAHRDPQTQYDLWLVSLSGDRKPKPFLRTDANESHACFAPNGRWVAYTSDLSGRAEVYVRAFPAGDGPWQISSDGGDEPQWRRDGRELFYLSPARRIMAAAVNGNAPAFQASPPQALFRARMRAPGIIAIRNDYVVRADGQAFLINKLVQDPAKATITVTLDWTASLAR
jgi:eukaryotic-like serine/threonine-protein kinase